jgi:hypothetical protein
VESKRSPKDFKSWEHKGDAVNDPEDFISEINSERTDYHLLFKNCQHLAERLWKYVTGKLKLHQAIAMFQRHESEMDAETESWIEYFASG